MLKMLLVVPVIDEFRIVGNDELLYTPKLLSPPAAVTLVIAGKAGIFTIIMVWDIDRWLRWVGAGLSPSTPVHREVATPRRSCTRARHLKAGK